MSFPFPVSVILGGELAKVSAPTVPLAMSSSYPDILQFRIRALTFHGSGIFLPQPSSHESQNHDFSCFCALPHLVSVFKRFFRTFCALQGFLNPSPPHNSTLERGSWGRGQHMYICILTHTHTNERPPQITMFSKKLLMMIANMQSKQAGNPNEVCPSG